MLDSACPRAETSYRKGSAKTFVILKDFKSILKLFKKKIYQFAW